MTVPLAVRLLLLAAAGAWPGSAHGQDADAPEVTFTRDVAPLVFRSCASCHRPGEAAPFPLLTYRDVAKRSRQIARVTRDRFMPPWLPEAGHLPFQDDRSLSEEEIALFERWAAAGAPEGDPADLPPVPTWPDGWSLGEPDLVVQMPRPFTVPAEGRDVYRNVVIPAPLDRTRYVAAVEFRPDNRRVLHHCLLTVDGSGRARAREEAQRDGQPGYPDMSPMRRPDGLFVGWIPGKVPRPPEEGVAWRLDPTTDIVLQLHLRPSGKEELIRVRLGLYFADGPPTEKPLPINVWSREIRIPPGEAHYPVSASYELPVDVEIRGVWPHAHYLGKDLRGWAELPDGTRRTLIHIPSWDFNWQEEYLFAEPLELPAGTRVGFDYVYDNSAENPFNPSRPPRRVVYGPASSDEMAELVLLAVPRPEERPILYNDYENFVSQQALPLYERLNHAQPERMRWYLELGESYLKAERFDEAIAAYQAALELRPAEALLLSRLGDARLAAGDVDGALADFEASLFASPRHADALVGMARCRMSKGHHKAAERYLERALRQAPGHLAGRTAYGELLAERGEPGAARAQFAAALAKNPETTGALVGMAALELEAGEAARAEELLDEALHLRPDHPQGLVLLSRMREAAGDRAEARRLADLALRFAPRDPVVRARSRELASEANGEN